MSEKEKPLSLGARQVMMKWLAFSAITGIPLAKWNPLHVRAEQLAKNGGKCPCKPKSRPVCPCRECADEVKRDGVCFCQVFGDLVVYKKVRGLK